MSRQSPLQEVLDTLSPDERLPARAGLSELARQEPHAVSADQRRATVEEVLRIAPPPAKQGHLSSQQVFGGMALKPILALSAALVAVGIGTSVQPWLFGSGSETENMTARGDLGRLALELADSASSGAGPADEQSLGFAPTAALGDGSAEPLRVQRGVIHSESGEFGAGQRPPVDAWLTTREGSGVLVLSDSSQVQLAAQTRIRRSSGEDVFELVRGNLVLQVNKRQPARQLRVETPELTVRVTGTEFSVKREVSGAAPQSRVELTEGSVWVYSKLEQRHFVLRPGQSINVPADAEASWAMDSKADAVTSRSVVPRSALSLAARKTESRPTRSQRSAKASGSEKAALVEQPGVPEAASASSIRSTIHRGNVKRAREMIHNARIARRTHSAELALLEAEVALKEGRRGVALRLYLGVFKQFPSSAQAEVALFAAAQLSSAKSAVGLSQRYLAHYPSGHFTEQAARLLESLEGRQGR